MESTRRARTVWAVALLSVLVGSILVYLGVTASFIGTALAVVGMLIMCVVIALSAPARQTETAATATAD